MDPFGLNRLELMRERLEKLQSDAFSGPQTTAGAGTVDSTITIEKLEQAMRDLDPDGRWMQRMRLDVECEKLTKQEVELVIRFAQSVLEYRNPEPIKFFIPGAAR